MSFDTEKNKSANYKIFLAEIDLPITADTFFAYTGGIWGVPMSPNFGPDGVFLTLDDGYEMTWEDTGMIGLLRIGSVQVDGENYARMTSISACDNQNNSFFHDSGIYMTYIHFDGYEAPWGKTVRLGIILGFCDKPGSAGAYYDDIYYDPRILSIPNLTKKKDNLFAGVLQHTGGKITLINTDGYFEDITRDWNIFGQPVRIYAGFDGLTFDEFRQIYSGNVDDYSYNRESFSINIVDNRKFLSRKIPVNQFQSTDYPYISEDNAGKVKPIAWGDIRNAPLVCLNETSTIPSTYQFYIADNEFNPVNSVTALRIDGVPLSSSKWSLTDNIIYISSAASTIDKSGDTIYVSDNLGYITADFNSYLATTKGLNVITNMLDNYAFVSTVSAVNNYNTTEWTSALILSKKVGVYLDEEVEISDVIKDICVAEDGIFLVQDDGRYTFRHESTVYSTGTVVHQDEWLGDPSIDYRREEYLTSVKIKYNKNQDEDEWESYTNKIYESSAYDKYKTYAQKEIDTVLTSTNGVYARSNSIMSRSKDIVPTVQRNIKQQHINLDIMDIVLTCHDRLNKADKQWAKYRLVGIQRNLDTAEETWTMRWLCNSTYTDALSTMIYYELTYGGSTITYDGDKIYYLE